MGGLKHYNSESPIYLCARIIKDSGNVQIHTIATIDLEYDENGDLKPFSQTIRKGKVKTSGTHSHDWTTNGKGIVARKSHDKNNVYPVNTHDKQLKKIVEFNKQQNQWK